MTLSQLLLYALFALGCGLGHLAWLQMLANPRRRRSTVPETLLSGRERLELEQAASDILQRRCSQDPAARETFLRACLNSVPQLSQDLPERLRQRPETALRLVVHSIRHLPDDRLVQLSERLECLPITSPLPVQRQRYQHLQPTWNLPQRIATGGGLALLCLILLAPPWVAQRQRQIRILGVSRSTLILERNTAGYHWLLARTIPGRQTTPRATGSLRRLEFDEYGWDIDYPRLGAQLFTLALVSGTFVWWMRMSEEFRVESIRAESLEPVRLSALRPIATDDPC